MATLQSLGSVAGLINLDYDPAKFSGDGSFFAKEIEYLRQHGYKFVKEGDLWHAVQ